MILSALAAMAATMEEQIISLSITTQSWEPTQPWIKSNPSRRLGSGVVVKNEGSLYLLTTALNVDNATMIQARKLGDPNEWIAKPFIVDREAGLALLAVEDSDFFAELAPVRFATAPAGEGTVTIARWKGNQLETVEGKVSRSVTFDSLTGTLGFAGIRVSTDLSGGGTGEPVFAGTRLVGLGISQGSSELGVMPTAFISSWLQEVAETQAIPAWVGDLGISVQMIRSNSLADWLGLAKPAGLLVLGVQQGGSACGMLRRGDVIVAIAGQALDGSGSIRDPMYGLLSYEYLLASYRSGDTLPISIVRNKVQQELLLPLRSYTGASLLVPVDRIDPPPYLMAGGLVFREFDEYYSARSIELKMLDSSGWSGQTEDQRRIVVLSSVLPDPYNLGYHYLGDLWVEQINGREIDGIEDAREAFKYPVDGYHVVRFHPNFRTAELVIDAATFEEATARIAKSYGIFETYRASAPLPELGAACEAGN